MKYKITLHNDWNENYWNSQNKSKHIDCKRVNTESYEVKSLDICINVIKDFMDAPLHKLTEKDVRKDFEDKHTGKLSREAILQILAYYNGRMDLQKQILKDLNETKDKPCILEYDIPVELNSFTCYPMEDEYPSKLNCAYIKIELFD